MKIQREFYEFGTTVWGITDAYDHWSVVAEGVIEGISLSPAILPDARGYAIRIDYAIRTSDNRLFHLRQSCVFLNHKAANLEAERRNRERRDEQEATD